MAKKVALVTGSQQGIGLCLVKLLSEKFDGDVIVTGLTDEDAKKAQAELESQGCKAVAHQLNVKDQASVDKLRDFVKENYGGLDILVNNAGISFVAEVMRQRNREVPPPLAKTSKGEIASETLAVNFFGTIRVCDAMFPLLRPGARVVHMSSNAGRNAINKATGDKVATLKRKDFTKGELCRLMAQYIKDVEANETVAKGWPEDSSFPLAAWGLWVLAKVHQTEMDSDSRGDIIVNAACPGFVATNFTNFHGETVEKGCETPLYLATLPAGASSPKGELVHGTTICNFEARPENLANPASYFPQ